MSDSLIPSLLMSNVSELLRSLTKNERCERIANFYEQIVYLLFFSQKTSDSLTKPMNKFPALEKLGQHGGEYARKCQNRYAAKREMSQCCSMVNSTRELPYCRLTKPKQRSRCVVYSMTHRVIL